ncbi:MAG: hypothetical protein M1833_003842 [Piccolia ochrophora]|nr:MAG: hypothetical protein M1833_003842 [Piccolia ochrophora]
MGSSSTFLISHDFATLTLIQEVFSTFWRRASALQGEGGHPDIDLRSKYLSILSDDIRSCKDHGKAHEDLQLLVRAVSAAPGLNTIRKGDPSFEPLKKIVKNLEEVLLLTSDGSSKPPRNVSASGIVSSFTASAFKICFALEGEGGIVKQEQIVSLLKQVSYFDGAAVALVLQDHAKSLDESSKLDLLSSLLSDTWAGSPEGNQILWVRAIVSVIDSHSDETNAALSRSCNICCSKLPKAQNEGKYTVPITTDAIADAKQPKVVSQWDVECALAAIALTASARGPHVSSRGADKIFARLCQLFFSVLMVHRLKLRRRYHIVLPALQALLRCLFVPGTWLKGKDSRARLLPPWISSKIHRLNASHGAAYARLLTSLCDPTVSSVTAPRSKAGEELTPARDMAKRIAGQHLPYLLVEYAQCQLQSRMLPEVKQSLLPGLFAIFDAANQDVLRMINSAMDSPSQAIYKGLYDEYKQSRAWEER